MFGGDAPLGEEFLDVAIGKGESQIPAHRTGNDGRFEVAPFEQRWPGFAHQAEIRPFVHQCDVVGEKQRLFDDRGFFATIIGQDPKSGLC